jgi:molybdopterin-guanine dinucleotide biosynthesis protein A
MACPYSDITGLILAGGRNSRMGGLDKSRLAVNGEPLVRWIADLLGNLFEEVILVTNNPELHRDLVGRLLFAEDIFPGRGPLAGIQAGMACASGALVFCVACDMPGLRQDMIERQIEIFRTRIAGSCDVLIPRIGELIEPLHALYRTSLESLARRILTIQAGCSVRTLLAAARSCYWDLEDTTDSRSVFANLNTPKDLRYHLGGELPRR